ncbi:MAG: phosphatidylserine decarboxylase, partial [Petrotogales bacterium]
MLAKGSTKPIALSFLPTIFSFLFYLLGLEIFVYISIISLLFPVLIVIFFRDPDRKIGEGIVSPADGKIVVVDKENNSFDIFMNITNVHVNRAPEGGLIDKTKKFRGGYYP